MVGGGAKFFLFFNKMKRDEDLEQKKAWKSGFPEKIFVEYCILSISASYPDVWPRLGRPRAA